MLGRAVVLRFSSSASAAVAQQAPKARSSSSSRHWLAGAAAAAGVVLGGCGWLAATAPNDAQADGSPAAAMAAALASFKASAAHWLAQKAEDPESREALLAFGSSRLLDFLLATATEEGDPSPQQQHAEQALVCCCKGGAVLSARARGSRVCGSHLHELTGNDSLHRTRAHCHTQVNFLGGYHTASRLLARPGVVPALLQHIADGRASAQLQDGLSKVLEEQGADFAQGLSLDDARRTLQLLEGEAGQQVRACADEVAVRLRCLTEKRSTSAHFLGTPCPCCDHRVDTHNATRSQAQVLALHATSAWSRAGACQRGKLCSLGLPQLLGQLAMQAVAQGDAGRQLQADVCR
jgi:hypothetical protein